jgi:hypothetical protein
MAGRRINALSLLRTKIKNGWLKEAPPEYFMMIRNPPSQKTLRPKEGFTLDNPYTRYVKKAMQVIVWVCHFALFAQ